MDHLNPKELKNGQLIKFEMFSTKWFAVVDSFNKKSNTLMLLTCGTKDYPHIIQNNRIVDNVDVFNTIKLTSIEELEGNNLHLNNFNELKITTLVTENTITEKKILDLGFKLYGVEENDPYYKIMFRSPFKFGISSLSGVLQDGEFWLYGNDVRYTQISELKKIIDVVGSEIYKQDN